MVKKRKDKKEEAKETKLIQPSDLGKPVNPEDLKTKTIAEIAEEQSGDKATTTEPQESQMPATEPAVGKLGDEKLEEESISKLQAPEDSPSVHKKDLAPESKIEKPEKKNKEKKPKKKGRALFLSVPLQEKVLFTRHLSIGIKSGMTLIAALELISEQTKSKSLKTIISQLIEDVNAGMFLSKSLEKYRKVFGELFVNIIKIGESSGTLAENLLYLTEELKKKHALRSKVRGALIYPSVVLVATLGIAGSMIIFIFPKILPVFASLNVELPFTTRALISISNLLSNHGLVVGVSLVLVVIGFVALLKIRAVRHVVHHILLYTPVIKKMTVQVNMANFARTFGLLLKSGVNIIEAISITADTTGNLVYHHEFKASVSVLQKGEFLSSYLSNDKKLFPPIAVNMMRVGENTGNLTENLDYLSEYYEGQVDDFVKNLSSIIEPALMLIMGVIVGFIALSIITPIYSLTQGLQK
jgi:type IV pilus assembly protein PilC